MKISIYFSLIILIICSCARHQVASQRGIDGFVKPGKPMGHSRGMGTDDGQLYRSQTQIRIATKDPESSTGSLVDERKSELFADRVPYGVGDVIEIKVVPENQDANKTKDTSAAVDPNASNDAFVKEMLAQLPQLDPGEQKIPLLSTIKMRVDQIFDNGDLLLSYRRESSTDVESKEVSIMALLPRAGELKVPTTQDLTDISWQEKSEGRMADRSGHLWKDEYSLRLSGYSEARSAQARQLEDKRKQLASIRERMSNQLVSLGKERQTMAKEREALNKQRSEIEAKNEELKKEVDASKEEISALKESEAELKSEVADAEAEKSKEEKGDEKPEPKPKK